ncbi:MAG TPA: hypothetical protein VGV18_00030, partial [Verrucomicrobiae bacterium]|nr:hypothetical protein [Verrucomicrobiae bacterium]
MNRIPDSVDVKTETGIITLVRAKENIWTNGPLLVTTAPWSNGLQIVLSAPAVAVKSLQIHWQSDLRAKWLYLGDAWERAYGDLDWKPLNPRRIMPWYFLANHGGVTDGFGVKTGPSALCYWRIETNCISLQADVRCGGMGVQLGQRALPVCTIVCRQGQTNETPFTAVQALCRQMCARSRMPPEPVYGFNDWYC